MAATPLYGLTTDRYSSGELEVVSLRGVEQLSEPFSFRLRVTGPRVETAAFEHDLMGSAAHLWMVGAAGSTRYVHGIVRRVETEGVGGGGEQRHHHRVWIAPRLWLLGLGKASRIFQDQSVREIVTTILKEAGVSHRWRLASTLPKREYCVQHQESDLHFITRLLAEEGVFYFFEHPAEEKATSEILVLSDSSALSDPIAGDSTLVFDDSGGMVEHTEHVRRFRRRRKLETGSTLLTEFDFLRPSLDLSSTAAAAPEPGGADERGRRAHDHHGEYQGATVDARVAALHLEQHRRHLKLGVGESRCRRLVPGSWFELSGNPAPDLDGRYVVLRVEHEGRDSAGMRNAASPGEVYDNHFICLPAEVACRPRRPRRVIQQSLETAIVVGPEGQEIHTDEHARIKVQFHWDREGKRNENSSCWIRTMHAWAGASWGTQFIPRIGMEVLVLFLGGDTDRPMILGSAYNAEHPPPFALPLDKTKSGIRTQSSIGGGRYNELSFEDSRDHEKIFLRAQKDFDEVIEDHHSIRVGSSETHAVTEDRTVQIGRRQVTRVGADRESEVGGSSREKVAGDHQTTIGGTQKITIAGSLVHTTDGDSKVVVNGAGSAYVEKDQAVRINGAQQTLVGTKDAPAKVSVIVWGEHRITASTTALVEAEESLTLRCGSSTITMTPEEITIASRKVRIVGSSEVLVEGKTAWLKLDGDGYLNGTKAQIHSRGASVVLDQNANVDGALVRLNCGPSSAKISSDSSEESPPTRGLQMTVADGNGEALAGKRYELVVDGDTFKGSTDGSGKVTADIPEKASFGVLTVWTSDTDKQVYQLGLAPLPAASTPRGALTRLKNLNYYAGEPKDELDEKGRQALIYFQKDNGLPPTGELDGTTQAKIEEAAHR